MSNVITRPPFRAVLATAGVLVALATPAAAQEKDPFVFYGLQAEQLEYRVGDNSDVFAWDFDAFFGTDDWRVVLRSEAEYAVQDRAFETLENQLRVQIPVATFFDAVAGVRLDTPDGPDRVYGVLGLHGLAPQWFEVDADIFVSDHPSFRFEAEYEGLITNRIIFTPSIEVDLPFTDEKEIGVGAFGPKIEVGARLSYDLVDRAVSPYIGVHYERLFGESAQFARDEGEEVENLYAVIGVRLMF